jgi:hypothetical protein
MRVNICTIHQTTSIIPISYTFYCTCSLLMVGLLVRNLSGRKWIRPNPLWVELELGWTLPYSNDLYSTYFPKMYTRWIISDRDTYEYALTHPLPGPFIILFIMFFVQNQGTAILAKMAPAGNATTSRRHCVTDGILLFACHPILTSLYIETYRKSKYVQQVQSRSLYHAITTKTTY